MTGAQFLDFLCSKSGQIGLLDKSYNDTSYRAFMLECLNLTLKNIAARQQNFHWRWLEKTATAPTIADQMDYNLPTDIDSNKTYAVFDRTNDITYRFIPYDRFVRLVADPSNNTGDPRFWTFWADVIKLYPVPSSVITIYMNYIKTITTLTDSAGSTTDVPTKYDPVIIDGALSYAYRFDPQLGSWADHQRLFENGVVGMVQDNSMMIAEKVKTESHRDKYNQSGFDGQTGLFPWNQGFA